jgi:hypothetical protein
MWVKSRVFLFLLDNDATQTTEAFMIEIALLEQHVSTLDDDSFSKFRIWFREFEQKRWDKKIEADSNAGKLDFLIDAAVAEHRAGKTRQL